MSDLTRIIQACQKSYPKFPLGRLIRYLFTARDPQGFTLSLMLASSPRQNRFRTAFKLIALSLKRPQLSRSAQFSASFYRAAYPDVAATGVNEWLHFQSLGRHEGRAPHPLIDPEWIASQTDKQTSAAIDWYFRNPESWELSPSPYLNMAGYLASIAWSGEEHPFVNLVISPQREKWLEDHLRTIDLLSESDPTFEKVAGAMLNLPSRSVIEQASIDMKKFPREPVGDIVLAAGVCAIAEGRALPFGEYALSTDHLMVRHEKSVFFVSPRSKLEADSLFILPDLITRSTLLNQLPMNERILVAATNPKQHAALSRWLHIERPEVTLLPWRQLLRIQVKRTISLSANPRPKSKNIDALADTIHDQHGVVFFPKPDDANRLMELATTVIVDKSELDFWMLTLDERIRLYTAAE